MGKATARTTPLLLQSKLLCFSLLYLFSSLFLALYTSFSSNANSKCLFRSSPFDPIQSPLFSYPSSYGEHKHAVPTLRSSCSSPVFFSEYFVAFKEIRELCRNSSSSGKNLRYLQGKARSFGGNFDVWERVSSFDHSDDAGFEVPCGFFKDFPVSDHDRKAMENCAGVVVVSAIFGDHDKIRQPKGLGSKTPGFVCFFMFADDSTLRTLDYHNLIPKDSNEYSIGVWRIVRVSVERLYESAAMNGMIPKYLVHRLFPNSKYSIWIDAKLQLVVDPLLLIHSLVISENVDMAISRHPYYIHTMEEAMATARWRKWFDVDSLKKQMETYCENGLQPWTPKKHPYPSDVPDSALILRKHSVGSNRFSCLLFNELEAFNPRDQLPFAYVRDKMKPKLKMNMFEVEVFEQIAVEYRHNLGPGGGSSSRRTKRAVSGGFVNGSSNSRCESYLLEMWGEPHD
ncbi:probable hexosyltransferase MUCI70 [Diospyros lotus]|uniref:probable hexosyltransferase MUCI70 n=1 Tax=Diospyros lotus TaxID=55363 RepID=UPI00225526E3|nr:probable hexosyltransferase MUCI70 [Diospyros lotus]